SNGDWAMAEDGLRPLHAFFLKAINRDNLIDQAHFKRFLCVVLAAQIPDFTRLLLPDDTSEIARAIAAVEAAHARTGLPENRVIGGNRQVADHVQHVTAANRITRN